MPKTKNQNAIIKSKRRNEIIRCTTYIFATTEYNNVTIDGIANEIGCSHGLFYHYFKNKEEIFGAVLENSIIAIKEIINFDEVNGAGGAKGLIIVLNQLFHVLKNGTDYENAIFYLFMNLRLQATMFDKNNVYLKECLRASDKLNSLIKIAHMEKELRCDPMEVTVCLFAMLKGLFYNRLYVGQNLFICPKLETVLSLLGIENESEAK